MASAELNTNAEKKPPVEQSKSWVKLISDRTKEIEQAIAALPRLEIAEYPDYDEIRTERLAKLPPNPAPGQSLLKNGERISTPGFFRNDIPSFESWYHDQDSPPVPFVLPHTQADMGRSLQGVPLCLGVSITAPTVTSEVLKRRGYEASIEGLISAPVINPDLQVLRKQKGLFTDGEVICLFIGRITSVAKEDDGYTRKITLEIPGRAPVKIMANERYRGTLNEKYLALAGEEPQVGDIVQAPTVVYADPEFPLYIFLGSGLRLIQPNGRDKAKVERDTAAYFRGSQQIENMISGEQWRAAREAFASLRPLCLSREQQRELENLVSKMPPSEQPVHKEGGQLYYIAQINSAYGVSIESMNVEQFTEFGKKMAAKNDPLMREILSLEPAAALKEAKASMLRIAFDYLMGISPEKRDFDFERGLGSGVRNLMESGTPDDMQKIIDVLVSEVEKGHFSKALDGGDDRLCSVIRPIITAIDEAMDKAEMAEVVLRNFEKLKQANTVCQEKSPDEDDREIFNYFIGNFSEE